MKKGFSISEAARITHMTSEALRHYDRIGLVKPAKKDEHTGYRRYSQQDIVRLNTIHALQQMDLSLKEIKAVLEYDDLQKIIQFLEKAERKADEKILELQHSKTKIRLAKADYEKKLAGRQAMDRDIDNAFEKEFQKRVIMLSDTLKEPTLENLWNYLSHFYNQIDPASRVEYAFEDLAGIYTKAGTSRLFAVCTRCPNEQGLVVLPEGRYLCATCAEKDREATVDKLLKTAKRGYGVEPGFTIQLILVSGILQWDYQVQVYIGGK